MTEKAIRKSGYQDADYQEISVPGKTNPPLADKPDS